MKKLAKKNNGGANKFSRTVSKSRYNDNRESNGNPLGSSEPRSGTNTTIVKTRPTITGGTRTVVKNKSNDDGPGGKSTTKSVTKTNSKGEIISMNKMGGATKSKKKK